MLGRYQEEENTTVDQNFTAKPGWYNKMRKGAYFQLQLTDTIWVLYAWSQYKQYATHGPEILGWTNSDSDVQIGLQVESQHQEHVYILNAMTVYKIPFSWLVRWVEWCSAIDLIPSPEKEILGICIRENCDHFFRFWSDRGEFRLHIRPGQALGRFKQFFGDTVRHTGQVVTLLARQRNRRVSSLGISSA